MSHETAGSSKDPNFDPDDFFQGNVFAHARNSIRNADDSEENHRLLSQKRQADNIKNSYETNGYEYDINDRSNENNSSQTRIYIGDNVVGNHGLNPLETPFTVIGNDVFFKHLYDYHQKSGFFCILLSETCYILTNLFTILFSTFITTCVDWQSIHKGVHKDLRDAIYPMCRPEQGRNKLVTFMFSIFIIWWIIITIRTVLYLMRVWKIKEIWSGILGLSNDVKWVSWQNVIDRYHERIDDNVDSHYIVNRIMRWDNYLNMMLTKDEVLKFKDIPFLGENAFTKYLEWNLHRSLTNALFRDDEILIKDVMLQSQRMEYVQRLKKTFVFMGVLGLLFAPFVISALTVYFIYRYVSEYHQNPKAMGLYNFTPIAKWKLRDFNELPHVYTTRLNKAHPKIIEYLGQFVNEEVNIIFKFLSFVLGATLLILVIVSFFNNDIFISLFLVEQPIIFYIGVVGALFVAIQNSTVDESVIYEPEEKFNELVKILHCSSNAWSTMNTKDRYLEIRKLFRYKWILAIEDIISVIYVPFIMIFWMPQQASAIVNFMRENSSDVEKLGIICSCAMFDESSLDMINPEDDDVTTTSNSIDRKMTLSVMNFRQSYPTWDPNRFKRSVTSHARMNKDHEERLRAMRRINPVVHEGRPFYGNYNTSSGLTDALTGKSRATSNDSTNTNDTYRTANSGVDIVNERTELFYKGNRPRQDTSEIGSYGVIGNSDFSLPFPLVHEEPPFAKSFTSNKSSRFEEETDKNSLHSV